MMAGVKASKQIAARRFVQAAMPAMTKGDRDGVGYVASALSDGELFGERWLSPSAAFKYRTTLTRRDLELQKSLKGAVQLEERYNAFGPEHATPFGAIIAHSRMATCGVSLTNTHPFVKDETGLCHNGVITNSHSFKSTLSTCDSEAILTSYLDNDVDAFPENIQETAKELEGYYACGILARDRENRRVLDIFRSPGASLYVAWVHSVEAWAYCTKAEILRDAARRARTKLASVHEIKSGYLIRLDAITGEGLSVTEFTPAERRPLYLGSETKVMDMFRGSPAPSAPEKTVTEFVPEDFSDGGLECRACETGEPYTHIPACSEGWGLR